MDDNEVEGTIKRPLSQRQTSHYKITERGKVLKEMVHELRNPSFEDSIRIAASTINPEEKTKDLNEKRAYKQKVNLCQSNVYSRGETKSLRVVQFVSFAS